MKKYFLDKNKNLNFAPPRIGRHNNWIRGVLFWVAVAALWFTACRKDHFAPFPDPVGRHIRPNYPISVFEAMAHFASVQGAATNSLNNENAFVQLDPVWTAAYLSQSQSGREIVVVPLADSSLRVLNDGRADAKLLFSKDGPEEITAEIMLYVADSAYVAGKSGGPEFEDYTGLYVFFDLGQNFMYGIGVENGIPSGSIISVEKISGPGAATPRTNGGSATDDCIEHVTLTRVKCDIAYDECYALYRIVTKYCPNTDPGGTVSQGGNGSAPTGGGGFGNGSSNNNGGSNNGGSNNGNNSNEFNSPLWDVFTGSVPMDIFAQNPALLPVGFDTLLVRQFININKVFNFLPQQLLGLSKNPGYIRVLYELYAPWVNVPITPENQQHAPNSAHVKAVLDFALRHQLTPEQFQALLQNGPLFQQVKALTEGLNLNIASVKWLIGNPDAAAGMHQFYTGHEGLENAQASVLLLLEYAMANNITDPLQANFQDYGENAFVCGPCFSAAWSVEYAILKRDQPCPSGDRVCDWKLRAMATWNVIGTGVHILLDLAGMVPVIGEIADLTNGVLYTLEGNYADASLSYAGTIPFVGWTATGAKYARKVVNLGGNAMELKYIVRSDGIIQFGESLNSARSQLRTILKTPAGHQAHHIVPWEHWDHPVVQAAADVKIDGFHMNELLNGISLPTSAGSLPKHVGSHPDYSDRVFDSLEAIKTKLGNNMSPNDAAWELRKLIQEIDAKIRSTPGGTINDVSGW